MILINIVFECCNVNTDVQLRTQLLQSIFAFFKFWSFYRVHKLGFNMQEVHCILEIWVPRESIAFS
jgi:hypothetical protein